MTTLPAHTRTPHRRPGGRAPARTTRAKEAPERSVAAYDDYRRALAAVRHLREAGHHDPHVALVAFDEVEVRRNSTITELTQRASLPAAIGAALTVAATAVWDAVNLNADLRDVIFVVLVASAVASVATGVVRGLRHGLPGTSVRLVPKRYEVRCRDSAGNPDRSPDRHLASWWQTGIEGAPMTPDGSRLAGR
jgi:hypothetical protein